MIERLIYLTIIAGLLLFGAFEYARIEAHYKWLEDQTMYIFNKCKL